MCRLVRPLAGKLFRSVRACERARRSYVSFWARGPPHYLERILWESNRRFLILRLPPLLRLWIVVFYIGFRDFISFLQLCAWVLRGGEQSLELSPLQRSLYSIVQHQIFLRKRSGTGLGWAHGPTIITFQLADTDMFSI